MPYRFSSHSIIRRKFINGAALAACASFASFASLALATPSAIFAQDVKVSKPTTPASATVVQQIESMPAIPKTPAMVLEVLEVIPFELTKPYEHTMRKERPSVTRGHVMVIRSTNAMVMPRQVAEPVLLAGDARGGQTAERVSSGNDAELLVIVLPEWTVVGDDGVTRVVDPLSTRLYFATPELPERVDLAWIKSEGVKADAAGLAATLPTVAPSSVTPRRQFEDRTALGRLLADLLERHTPTDKDRIEALRAAN